MSLKTGMGSPDVSSDVTKGTLARMLTCDKREGLLNLCLNRLSFQNASPETFCMKMRQDEVTSRPRTGPTHTPAAGSEKPAEEPGLGHFHSAEPAKGTLSTTAEGGLLWHLN